MAKARTPQQWLALKPGTRQRYASALRRVGIDNPEQFYLSGERLNVARGHTIAPEHPGRSKYVDDSFIPTAERAGITMWIPDWDTLPRTTQAEYARVFINGRFTKWTGRKLTRTERRQRGLLATDTRELRMPSLQQYKDQIEWDRILLKYRTKTWGTGVTLEREEDWPQFRINYMTTFGNA